MVHQFIWSVIEPVSWFLLMNAPLLLLSVAFVKTARSLAWSFKLGIWLPATMVSAHLSAQPPIAFL